MADTKISELPVAVSVDGTEYIPLVQNGTTKRVLGTTFANLVSALSSGNVSTFLDFGVDNVLIRSDGITKSVQASGITVDDSNNVLGMGTLGVGAVTSSGAVTGTNLSGTNTGDQSLFSTISVAGQSDVVADTTSDTLTLVAGTNVTITTVAGTDSITINATGSGNVSKVGTPLDNQVGVWTGDGTIEGDASLTFDTVTDALSITTAGIFTTGTIELGAAADTTLARVSAGVVSVEGVTLLTTATGQPLDATLTALAAYNTNGLITQTAADTFTGRTITGTASQITLTNGDGVAGNPTISLPADVLIPTVLTVPNTGLHVLDTDASHDLIVKPGSNLTVDRTFTLTTGDADRTFDISAASVTISSFGATLVDDADATAARATLGLVIGTNVQAWDADLDSWAAITRAAGFDTFATTPSSANLASLVTGETGTGALMFGTSPSITTDITIPNTGLHVLDTDSSHDLIIVPGSNLTVDRTLTITTGDADRTLTISASATVSQDYSTTGNPQFASIELGAASDTTITRTGAGAIAVEGATIWTSANDGAGSTLDADLLDGKNTGTSGNAIPLLDGTNTWSGQQTISLGSAATTEPLRLVNTTDNASVQAAQLEGDRATMAANDEAYVSLLLSDSVGTQTEFGRLSWVATDVTDTSEDGRLDFAVMTAGALADELQLTGSALAPSVSAGLDLGTSALPWNVGHVTTIELGAAADTTLARVSAGVISVEGVTVLTTATGQPLDSTLTAFAAYNTAGLITQTAADTFTGRTVTGTANQITLTNGDGVAGNPTISLPADVIIPTVLTVPNTGLHILDTNATHDLILKPGSDLTIDRTLTITTGDADRTIDVSAASVTISAFAASFLDDANEAAFKATVNLEAGVDYQAFDATLSAFAAYNTNGLITQTAADTFTGRTITGTANEITLTNGDGVAGNPTVSIPSAVTLTGKTITGGTFSGITTTGTLTVSEALALSGDISPAQIAADTNDYAPTGFATASTLRLTTDASRNLTGLAAGSDGLIKIVWNVGAFNLVLKDESASSTAGNRFALTTDMTLTPDTGVILQYDSTTTRWRAVGGAGGGSGSVATDTIWDAKGDLAAGTGADTAARLAVGTNGQILTADSAEATGLKWTTAAGGGNVSNTGVPLNNQLAVWTNATTIEGVTALTFDGAANPTLQITSTDAGATAGPFLTLYRDSLTPADADVLGQLIFSGKNVLASQVTYATIQGTIVDELNTSEDGSIVFSVMTAGALGDVGTLSGTGLNLAASDALSFGGVSILSDSAGTTTLANIDALDATTESTVEAAIDTLANLTSIQGRTVTLADAGANAVFGWDDVAGAYENLTAAEVVAIIVTADGSGSGLDADLLDGKNTGTSGNVVPLLDGANTWSGQQTISLGSAATTEPLRLVNTTDNASVQVAQFEGDRATMAANDEAYASLLLSDSAGTQTEFARLTWVATDVTDTSEDGQLELDLMIAGTLTQTAAFSSVGLNLAASDALSFGGVSIISDSAGTTTLSNIDALDATTEATIEAAIDTLSNLTSVGTLTTGVWDATTITVNAGGTGIDTATAYAVLCGGTTATGPFQSIASVGTATHVLTSNGAGALPTFQAAAGGGGGLQTLWIPAGGMYPQVTSGAAIGAREETTNLQTLTVYDFDDAADEHVQFQIGFPKSWDEGTVTFQVSWFTSASVTTGVAWGLQGYSYSDNEAIDVAWGTPVVVTDVAQSGANELYKTATSSAVTIGGTPSEGDIVYFRLFRDVSDAADTMTQDARLIGIRIFYTTTTGTDA